jgi:hypothetical protein
MFEKAGFKEVSVHAQTGFCVMWTLKFNYQSTCLIRGPRPMREFMGLLLRGVWALNQRIAPLRDKYRKSESGTARYSVVAHKA